MKIEKTIKIPSFVERMWETTKGIQLGGFDGSWFKSIKIEGDIVTLEVPYKLIDQLCLEMKEYTCPTDYAFSLLVHRFGANYRLPEGFHFFFRFGPHNFLVIKYIPSNV